MKLRLSEDFVINSDVEPWRREGLRIAMLGGPGSGKSWNNSLIAEQFLQQGGTVVIFQPRDEYFTLKEKFDVLSVGGVHAKDMEFALTSPGIYAKAVVEDGISMIFYTSAAEDEVKMIDWVSRFINQVLKYQEQHRRPLLLILEEAQEYAPRSPSGHVAPPWVYNRMIKAFKDCFTQGRKLNIIAVASSQRPQELNFTIRQLANLTFYGKFSNQDIKYIENDCLKYVRKQFEMAGDEVVLRIIDGSRLVDSKLGEWLVIMGKNSRFITVTTPRLTKHGAETPRLEYVAPRPTEAKKTIDELSKSILAALEKEEAEKSELEKAKKRVHDLEEQLKAAEAKANIKLSVKEMIEGPTVQPNAVDTNELVKIREENARLREQLDLNNAVIGKLQEEIKPIQAFKKSLIDFLDIKPTAGSPGFEPASSTAGLQRVVTVVDLEEVKKQVPKVPTDTIKGKILVLARDGFFNGWQSVGDISKALIEKYSFNATEQAINGALKDLVEEHILGMKHTDRNRWKLAPDVVFEGKKEVS